MFKSRLASLASIFLVSTVQVQIANGDCNTTALALEVALEAGPNYTSYLLEVLEAKTSCLSKDDCEPDYSKAKKVCENDLDGDFEWYLLKTTMKCAGTTTVSGESYCIPLSSCAEEEEIKKDAKVAIESELSTLAIDGCTAEISLEDLSGCYRLRGCSSQWPLSFQSWICLCRI